MKNKLTWAEIKRRKDEKAEEQRQREKDYQPEINGYVPDKR